MNKTFKIEDCIAGYCGDITLDTNHELKEYEDKIASIIKDKVKSNILKAIKYLHTNSKSTINAMVNKLNDTQMMDDNNLSEYIFNEYVKIKTMNVIDYSHVRKISIIIPITSGHISNIDVVDKVIKMTLILKQIRPLKCKLKEDKNEITISDLLKEYSETINYKTSDLLKDYVILHSRIKALYKMLEINRCVSWYWFESAHINKKNHWKYYYDIVKNTVNDETLGLIKFKEDMENTSVRSNKIRDIKNEIKRYHRLQSNIQNILNDYRVNKNNILLYRKYNTEEVPSQFKNNMNYSYRLLWKSGQL